MGREVSIFADYHQKENSLTNYCGLLMKLIYQESPGKFEELLAALVSSEAGVKVGPNFTQQTKKANSIPDLSIVQKSFSIFFETKTTDWFYDEQIERHLEGFNSKTDHKVLFLLSNFEEDDLEKRFQDSIHKAKHKGIHVQPITFEDLVGSMEVVCDTDYLLGLLDEFKVYLDRNGHLPKWKYLLDVVSCSGTMHEIDNEVYMCPDTGGPYSHRRAKYFGPYAEKEVNRIFEIKAVVAIDKCLSNGEVRWKNSSIDGKELIEEAKQKIRLWENRVEENKSSPLQVFLLGNGVTTKFEKETSGGMMQSKKYFWDIAIDCNSSQDLASKLDGKNWGEFS